MNFDLAILGFQQVLTDITQTQEPTDNRVRYIAGKCQSLIVHHYPAGHTYNTRLNGIIRKLETYNSQHTLNQLLILAQNIVEDLVVKKRDADHNEQSTVDVLKEEIRRKQDAFIRCARDLADARQQIELYKKKEIEMAEQHLRTKNRPLVYLIIRRKKGRKALAQMPKEYFKPHYAGKPTKKYLRLMEHAKARRLVWLILNAFN